MRDVYCANLVILEDEECFRNVATDEKRASKLFEQRLLFPAVSSDDCLGYKMKIIRTVLCCTAWLKTFF